MQLLHICLYPNVEGETDFYKKFTLTLLHPLPHQHPEPVERGVMSCGVCAYIYNYYVILLYGLEILEVLRIHRVEKTSLNHNFLSGWALPAKVVRVLTPIWKIDTFLLARAPQRRHFPQTNTSRSSSLPPSVLPCCRCEAWKRCFHPDWVRFPFDGGECKCVIYTCLVFYHDKAVHTQGKGGEETRVQWLHSSPVLFHSHACDSLSCCSQRPSRGRLALKQISHILLFDFGPSPCRLSY